MTLVVHLKTTVTTGSTTSPQKPIALVMIWQDYSLTTDTQDREKSDRYFRKQDCCNIQKQKQDAEFCSNFHLINKGM